MEGIMIKYILRCLVWPSLLIMLLIIGTEPVFSYPKYKKLFRDKYNVSGRINSCVVCHSKGGKSNLNSYGKSFLRAGATLDSLVRIEKLDSDKDGALNLYEIRTYHYPGDGIDRPSEVELNRYLAGEMVSPHLERELFETLRCPCGCDETIDTCRCKLIPELKKTIRENIEMRKDYDQIKKIMAKKYGVEILPLGERSETLSPSRFKNPQITTAYKIASEIPHILKELPCFCFCYGKKNRHESLLDCFKSLHGKSCKICIDETVMAFKLQNEGLNYEEIEKEIVMEFRKN
jgi:hypothetical protein